MRVFKKEDGFFHLVFANQDTYYLDSMIRLNLTDYLYYSLKKAFYDKIVFVSGYQEPFTVRVADRSSYDFCMDNMGFNLGFFSRREEFMNDAFQTIEMNSKQLRRMIGNKNTENTAFVFRLDTFSSAFYADIMLLQEVRKRSSHKGNIIVLCSDTSAENSLELLTGEDCIFRKGDLIPQISMAAAQDDFYGILKKQMGASCVFLNQFTPDAVKNVLQSVSWMNGIDEISDADDIAAYICRWFHSQELRDLHPSVFTKNEKKEFSILASDIRNGLELIRNKASEWKIDRIGEPDKIELFVREESDIVKDMRMVSVSKQFAQDNPGCLSAWNDICIRYQTPRCIEWNPDIRKQIKNCIGFFSKAVSNNDAESAGIAVECLTYGRVHGFSFDERENNVWEAYFQSANISLLAFQTKKKNEHYRNNISRWEDQLEALMDKIDRYPPSAFESEKADYELLDMLNRCEQLNNDIETQEHILALGREQQNKLESIKRELKMATHQSFLIDSNKIQLILSDAVDSMKDAHLSDERSEKYRRNEQQKINELRAYGTNADLRSRYNSLKKKKNDQQESTVPTWDMLEF